MGYLINDTVVAMGAFSGSTSTSPAVFTGDARLVTLSVQTSNSTSAATFIIQGSNADGLTAGDLGGPSLTTGWSNITILLPASLNLAGNVGRGLFTFNPPGYRWMRSATSADPQTASIGTLIFNMIGF